jgi:RHS repeat-associated protein
MFTATYTTKSFMTYSPKDYEQNLFLEIPSHKQRQNATQKRLSRYKYKYQGQERQDELGLNWDSFKYRNYDYAIGRFMSIDPLAEKYYHNSTYAFSENRVVDAFELEGLEAVQVKDTQSRCIDVTVKVQPVNNTVGTFAPMTNEQVGTAMGNFVSQTNSSYSGKNATGEQVNVSVVIDPAATLTVTFQPLVENPEIKPDDFTSQALTASAAGAVLPSDHGNTQTGNMQVSSQNTMPQSTDKPGTEKSGPGHTASHEFGHISGLEHNSTSAQKPGNLMSEGASNSARTITPEQRTEMLSNIPTQ